MSESLKQYALKEYIGETVKVSRKKIQNKMAMEVLAIPFFDVTLENLHPILELIANHSYYLTKLEKFVTMQRELFELGRRSIYQ